jgi:hypothetical protein
MADEPTPTGPDEKHDAPAGEEAAANEAPPSEAVIADSDAPVGSADAVEPPAASEPAQVEAPAPEPPAAEQQPTPEPPAPEQPAAEQQPPPEPPAAEQQPTPEPPAPEQPAAERPPAARPAPKGGGKGRGDGKPRRDRPRRDRGQRPPRRDRSGSRQPQQRASGPLPFQELRDAATTLVDLFGARQALRDAFSALGDKERRDLARLVAEDGDWRVRARNIAAGSLGAGRVGKALAAQQISMARIEDMWPLTLSKEEAAERQARVRNARRRDERRAQRDSEREQRSDRVSRADLEKAQDGRVGAQIRIVIGGQPRDRKRKGEDAPKEEPKPSGSDVLDRLGY